MILVLVVCVVVVRVMLLELGICLVFRSLLGVSNLFFVLIMVMCMWLSILMLVMLVVVRVVRCCGVRCVLFGMMILLVCRLEFFVCIYLLVDCDCEMEMDFFVVRVFLMGMMVLVFLGRGVLVMILIVVLGWSVVGVFGVVVILLMMGSEIGVDVIFIVCMVKLFICELWKGGRLIGEVILVVSMCLSVLVSLMFLG